MKLTAILLFISCLQVSAHGFAQGKITMKKTRASLEDVLLEINRQTGVLYSANQEVLGKAKPIDINVKEVGLKEVLAICFAGQPLTYSLKENIIVVKERPNAPKVVIIDDRNPIDVHGKVTDEKGNPIAGVTVTIQGTGKQTLTDENGEFSLSSIDKEALLLFSSVNMEPFSVKVNGQAELTVKLKTKVREMTEVVVSTGYQNIPRERATGSFGFVNNSELNRKAGTDILSRLEGVTTGIQFDRRRFDPTQNTIAANNVIIRGVSTLSEEMKSPLVVIDNFPYDGDINNINPNDVESITILKDAAAASIWGARAGNGVIVITTKRGQYNQPFKLSFNGNVQLTDKPDLFAYPKMSSSDFIDFEQLLFNQGFYDGFISDQSFPALSPVVEILNKKASGAITANEAEQQINALKQLDVRNDFDKYIYRTGVNQQYSLNFTGGGTNAKYSLSGGYDKSLSNLIGDNYRRVTFRSMNNFVPVKNLEVNVGLAYTHSVTDRNSLGNIGNASYNPQNKALYPYARFANEDGSSLAIAKDYRLGYTDTAGAGKLMDWSFRPLDELRNANNRNVTSDILFTAGAGYKLNSVFSFNINYQYESSKLENSNLSGTETYFARNLINLYTQIQGNSVVSILPKGGILDLDNNQLTAHTGRAQINVNKNWGTDHEITGILGGEIRERKFSLQTQRVYGFDLNKYTVGTIDYVDLYPLYGNRGSNRIPDRVNINLLTDRFVSTYANMAYTLLGKYVLSASARQDAANVFGVKANNRWKPLWTTGVAWNVNKESFYNSNLVPYLKLRASFGYQGNVNNSISPNTIINYSTVNNIANLPWAFIVNAANPELSWESVRQLNIGLDFKVGQRITATIDAYRKKSINLLWTEPIDPTTGVLSVKSNNAAMVGKGLEVALQTINIKVPFKWNSEIGFTYNDTKVTEYSPTLDVDVPASAYAASSGLTIVGRKGANAYPLYSYAFAGLDHNTGDPLGYLGKNVSNEYQNILQQVYDTANLIYHGSSIPTTFGFFNNIFSYKDISLTVNISYAFGYYFRKNTISYHSLINNNAQHSDYSLRWQNPGDETKTNVPSFVYPLSNAYRDQFYAFSSANVFKGDNIRLQNIRLSYSLTKNKIKGLPVQSVQVYGNVENLGMLWKANDVGLDPDYNTGNAAFPLPKRFTIGAQLSL